MVNPEKLGDGGKFNMWRSFVKTPRIDFDSAQLYVAGVK